MFEVTFETRDVVMPENAILLSPRRDFLESLGLEVINALAAHFLLANKPRAAKNSEVLRDRWAAHAESRSQLRYRRTTMPQAVEDRAPSGVGDGAKHIGMGG